VEAEAAAPPPAVQPRTENQWPGYVWLLIGMGIAGAGIKAVDALQYRQQSLQQKMMEQMLQTAASQQPTSGFTPPRSASTPPGPVVDTEANPSSSSSLSSSPSQPTSASSDASSSPSPSASATASSSPSSENSPELTSQSASEGSSTGGASFFKDAEVVNSSQQSQQFQSNASSSTSSDGISSSPGGGTNQGKFTLDMLERMLDDPNMAESVKPYLPEGMKDPETFKSMMKNPMYRQQLEQMLENMGDQSGMMGAMNATNNNSQAQAAGAMPNMDMSSEEVRQQFDQLGVSPEELMQKVMADPELQKAFQEPRIQNALMECSQNPMNISKYNDDEEVMRVFTKISSLMPSGQSQ